MTRLEKAIYLKEKGYSYDKKTGKIYGIRGNEIVGKRNGYIFLQNNKPDFVLNGHHFAWYMTYGNMDFEMLDHINRDRLDNRILNLRVSNHQENGFNRNDKGYYLCKGKWKSQIVIHYKQIYLGLYDTEEEARNAYLEAKKKYHNL